MRRLDQNGIDLPRIMGTTTHLPAMRHEEPEGDRTRTWYTTNFRGVDHCPRCGGNHNHETGQILDGSGVLVIGIRRKRDHDGTWREIRPDERWARIASACDCIYGAWRHEIQRMPWADGFPGVPRWLTAQQWLVLVQLSQPGDSYLEAARRVRGETDWGDVLARIAELGPEASSPKAPMAEFASLGFPERDQDGF
jgi:hypothetical protein